MEIIIALIIGTITGLLGGYAGASGTSKTFRRIGIPLVLYALGALFTGLVYAILPSILLGLVYSIGYGENSQLYKFVEKNINSKDEDVLDICTRFLIGTFKAIAMIPWLLHGGITSKGVVYLLFVIVNTVLWFILGRDGKTIKIFNKDILINEMGRYFGDGLFATLLILM